MPEQNTNLHKQHYENYGLNFPGTRVQFIIDAKGSLIGARICDKKAETLTNFEKAGLKALELLQSWDAGKHNNKKVNVIITKTININ